MDKISQSDLSALSKIVKVLQSNPECLHDPKFDFFKTYLESLGAKIPDAPAKEDDDFDDMPSLIPEDAPKEEKKEEKKEEGNKEETNIIEVGGKRRRGNPREKKEGEGEGEGEGEEKGKKYKVGLLVMYAGFEYQGLQMNPGAHTVEAVLHKALISAGCISYDNQLQLQKIAWQRCARTDKGVSALGNVISCRLRFGEEEPPFTQTREKINSFLPENVRLFHIQRVPKSFNAKNACDSRTYEYLCPVSAFDPLPDYQYETPSSSSSPSTAPSESSSSSSSCPSSSNLSSSSSSPEVLQDRLNRYLSQYVGSHLYHNFTPKAKSEASSQRNILSFTASAPFTVDGVMFVSLVVKGQAFLLNQIRKMVGLMIWAVATNQPEWVIQAPFLPTISCKIFMVPGEFLLLRGCHFDYFYQGKQTTVCDPLKVEPFAEVRDKFRNEYIVPTMVKKVKEGLFNDWMEKFTETFKEFECLRGEEVQKRVELMMIESERKKERKLEKSRKRKRY